MSTFRDACRLAGADETCLLLMKHILEKNRARTPDREAYLALDDRFQELGLVLDRSYRSFLHWHLADVIEDEKDGKCPGCRLPRRMRVASRPAVCGNRRCELFRT